MKKKDLEILSGLYNNYYSSNSDEYLRTKVESWVYSLIDEGYDLSDYTWEDMYEVFINEDIKSFADRGGLFGPGGAYERMIKSSRSSTGTTSKPYVPGGGGMGGRRGAGRVRPSFQSTGGAGRYAPSSMQQRTSTGTSSGGNTGASVRPAAGTTTPTGTSSGGSSSSGGGNTGASAVRPASGTPTPPVRGGNAGASAVRPASGTTSGIVGGKTSPATSPTKPAIGMLGKTSFERRTPTSAELKAAQAARASGANPEQALQAAKSAGSMQKNFTRTDIKMPQYMKQDFSWGSNSKLVDDISNSYRSIYEAKKKDQDQDGDNDFADVRIARMIASGMSKEEAIRRVRGKSYNEEVEIEEATRMRKELGKQGEIAVRRKLAARSRAYKRSGSIDKTIQAAESEADRVTPRNRGESPGEYRQRMADRSSTLTRLAASRRKSVRDRPRASLRGYANDVSGDDQELQTSRQKAMSAGTLTPREKEKLGEDFELWINELLDEGYDLSDYTWDEMYQIYEETEEEKKRNERRARIAELTAQGRVMTSSKRTSQKARQRREAQNAERLEKLANAAIAATTGASRRSSQAMGSQQAPAPEPRQPANRRLKSNVKNDTLASRADEILRMLQNEDFKLWIAELLHEGYTLENWTDKELYDLYEEILEEKYRTTAGRKRV